jgi:hypothetical protein
VGCSRDARFNPTGFGWEPIDTAPIDKDVTVLVTDGVSEHRIPYPCRLTTASGAERYGRPPSFTIVKITPANMMVSPKTTFQIIDASR